MEWSGDFPTHRRLRRRCTCWSSAALVLPSRHAPSEWLRADVRQLVGPKRWVSKDPAKNRAQPKIDKARDPQRFSRIRTEWGDLGCSGSAGAIDGRPPECVFRNHRPRRFEQEARLIPDPVGRGTRGLDPQNVRELMLEGNPFRMRFIGRRYLTNRTSFDKLPRR